MPDPREVRRAALEARWGEPITLDALTGSWSILQRKRGHRHSTDDVLTAYHALVHGPRTDAALDLGTGIGTVGLMVLFGLAPSATLTCVEAQEVSYALLLENLALNHLTDRVFPTRGDLRVVPSDSQKAHARFELRGTVYDYATAALAALSDSDDARFVFCFPTAQVARAWQAIRAHGLSAVAWRDVIPRAGRAPLFSLFACRKGDHPEREEPPLIVRDASGEHTEELREVRRRFGFVVD